MTTIGTVLAIIVALFAILGVIAAMLVVAAVWTSQPEPDNRWQS